MSQANIQFGYSISFTAIALAVLSSMGCIGGEEPAATDETSAALSPAVYNLGTIAAPGKCIDVSGGSHDDFAQIQEWQCNGTGAQAWRVEDMGSSTVRLVNPQSGKCLDVNANGTANGTKIQLYTCNGTDAQRFWVEHVDLDVRFVGVSSSKCLDVAASGTADGTKIQLYSCNGTNAQRFRPAVIGGSGGGGGGGGGGGVAGIISESTFNAIFPYRLGVYSYQGFLDAAATYPAFGGTGDDAQRRREVAAFLANVAHESGHLQYVEEIAKAPYCQPSASCPCADGQWYYGRGALQLSWNYNYCAAGPAFGVDLRANPGLVASTPKLAWGTALWFWMTSSGAGTRTPHDGILQVGFGETIRSINGSIECNGGNPSSVAARIGYFHDIAARLGVSPGGNEGC